MAVLPWSHFLLEASRGGAHLQQGRAAVGVRWKEEAQSVEGWGGTLVFCGPQGPQLFGYHHIGRNALILAPAPLGGS